MSWNALSLFVALVIAAGHVSMAQSPSDVVPANEPYFEIVPGGNRLIYKWSHDNDGPFIWSLRYCGPTEWLVSQKHPRSNWNRLPKLEAIEIQSASLSKDEITYIASLKTVKSLAITETVFQKHAQENLGRMVWLKSLSLDLNTHLSLLDSRPSDDDHYQYPRGDFFKFLETLRSLEAIELFPECDQATYVRISALTNLKSLRLGVVDKIGASDAEMVQMLSRLESAHFQHLSDASPVLRGLRRGGMLRDLWFETRVLSTDDIANISSMIKLESLNINCRRSASLKPLGKLPKLKTLSITCDDNDDMGDGSYLAALENLEEFSWSGLAALRISDLRDHKRLRILVLNKQLHAEDLRLLQSMPQLKLVSVTNSPDSKWYADAKTLLPNVTFRAAASE